ncbi:MAG: hypothetical protein IKA80_03265 [Spirochaetaceae bacterium]|nr:hypothetical protein [Spirochaetaceae bacterium]MBR2361642.1 hypothetical protein [Spirochaetaceae bacterium]MBR2462054.1 hypothetical protein [Spirochaetaceae bacterium]
MSITLLEQKMQTLPEKYLEKIAHYIDFLIYESQREEDDLTRFNTTCQNAQQWATDVGFTEDDLSQIIQESRREKSLP